MDMSNFFAGGFLSHESLPKPRQIVTIEDMTMESIEGEPKQKPVLHFRELDTGLVLNKTNGKRLMAKLGIDSAMWIGHPVAVYRTITQYKGDDVLCVRIGFPQEMPAEPICKADGSQLTVPQIQAGIAKEQPPQDKPKPETETDGNDDVPF